MTAEMSYIMLLAVLNISQGMFFFLCFFFFFNIFIFLRQLTSEQYLVYQ